MLKKKGEEEEMKNKIGGEVQSIGAEIMRGNRENFVLPSGLKNLRGGELSSKVYQNLFAKLLSFESY